MREVLDGAVRYWPLVTAGIGIIAGVAVGADKLITLEESIRAQETATSSIQKIEREQAVTANKVENIEEIAKQNQAILLQLRKRD